MTDVLCIRVPKDLPTGALVGVGALRDVIRRKPPGGDMIRGSVVPTAASSPAPERCLAHLGAREARDIYRTRESQSSGEETGHLELML